MNGTDRSQPTETSLPPAGSISSRWWRRRHFRVPVAVWVAASVLAGAAIGAALEPDDNADDVPTTTTEVVTESTDAD